MKVSKIRIRNILGIEALDITPGAITRLEGANATGKTSALEALRHAFDGAQDATLLRQGAESGEVVLILDNGVEITKTVGAEKSPIDVRHPEYGALKNTAHFLRKVADAVALNPVEFLAAKTGERVDILLKTIPMTVTAEELRFVPIEALEDISLDDHALKVIAAIYRVVYDLRTGINREETNNRIFAEELERTFPEYPPEGTWEEDLNKATAELEALISEAGKKVAEVEQAALTAERAADAELSAAETAINLVRDKTVEKIRAERDKEVEKIRKAADKKIEAARKQAAADLKVKTTARDGTLRASRATRDAGIRGLEADFRPKESALKERITRASQMVEQFTAAETTREIVRGRKETAAMAAIKSKKLTRVLDQLDELKANKLSRLPIPGLEVRDGDIFIDGIPFDRVNYSLRVRCAMKIARLRAGTVPLVLVDGLESLDPQTYEAFLPEAERESAESGVQFIVSRVTADQQLAVRGGSR